MSVITSRIAAPLVSIAALALVAGCPAREVSRVDPTQTREEGKDIPVQINRDIDILFVIDNSGSMEQEQTSLAANFNRFINVLQNIEGGLPNVHIGVVSTDLGAGPFGIAGCEQGGDNGDLVRQGAGGCQGPTGPEPYIIDIADENGNRTTNYGGSLAETFSCMARLGINGCGFEQQLEAMRAALDGNPANQGFLRDEAFLAVIFITDEDDCSVQAGGGEQLFNTAQDSLDSDLGPLTSFRCFEYGVECEPDTERQDARNPGPRQNCQPRDNSEYLTEIQGYVDFLKGLKDDPGQVIVAGIIGNPSPVSVSVGTNNQGQQIAELDPSCQSGAGVAFPGVRMQAFLDSFPQRSTVTTICNEDLSDALVLIAELLATVIGNPCIEGDLKDVNADEPGVQPDCTVSDVTNKGQDNQSETLIPSCEVSNSIPCYRFVTDAEQCGETETQLSLKVCRGLDEDDPSCPSGGAQSVPPNTTTVVRCQGN